MINQKDKEFLFFKVPVFFGDLMLHFVALKIASEIFPDIWQKFISTSSMAMNGYLVLLTMSLMASLGIYRLRLHERKISKALILWRAIVQSGLVYIFLTLAVAIIYRDVPRVLIFHQFAISFPLVAIYHFIANHIVLLIRKSGYNQRKVVIIGADVTAKRVWNELSIGNSFSGYKLLGFFTSLKDASLPEGAVLLGNVSDFFSWIENNDVDELYCSLPPAQCHEEVNKIIKVCNQKLIEFYFVPTMDGYPKRHVTIDRLGNVNIVKLREEPMNNIWAKFIKRSADLCISGIFLCTLFPFVVIFVAIGNLLFDNRGPLFFRQERTGYNGKSFKIIKFRSMKPNKNADTLQATADDPRKTPFGDFLRRSSIDELPQFINVFIGDMSIIGPRPHMVYHTDVYGELIGNYMVRHLGKPGITGWAQVSNCRGETKTVEEMEDRVAHDIWYIEHWTVLLDVEIFFKTIWQLMPGRDKQAY